MVHFGIFMKAINTGKAGFALALDDAVLNRRAVGDDLVFVVPDQQLVAADALELFGKVHVVAQEDHFGEAVQGRPELD